MNICGCDSSHYAATMPAWQQCLAAMRFSPMREPEAHRSKGGKPGGQATTSGFQAGTVMRKQHSTASPAQQVKTVCTRQVLTCISSGRLDCWHTCTGDGATGTTCHTHAVCLTTGSHTASHVQATPGVQSQGIQQAQTQRCVFVLRPRAPTTNAKPRSSSKTAAAAAACQAQERCMLAT